MPGSSGRVHKNTEGEWVWSDDEMDTSNDTTAEPVSQSVSPAFKNFFTCQTVAKMSLLLFSILQVAVYALPLPWCLQISFYASWNFKRCIDHLQPSKHNKTNTNF